MQILHKSQKCLFLQSFLRPFISTANFTMNKGKLVFEILTCNFIIQELMVAFGPAVSSSFFFPVLAWFSLVHELKVHAHAMT